LVECGGDVSQSDRFHQARQQYRTARNLIVNKVLRSSTWTCEEYMIYLWYGYQPYENQNYQIKNIKNKTKT
jgi:hypothetical protein